MDYKSLQILSVAAKAHGELKNGAVPADLRKSFTENGISLSDKAYLSVEKAGVKWLITDGNTVYTIDKDVDKLSIYKQGDEMKLLEQLKRLNITHFLINMEVSAYRTSPVKGLYKRLFEQGKLRLIFAVRSKGLAVYELVEDSAEMSAPQKNPQTVPEI